jgi:signal transduction histidine kinase
MGMTTTDNLPCHNLPWHQSAREGVLWPLLLLLLGEALAIAFLAPPRAGEITPASLAVALLVLLAGIMPALLRPSLATNLVGCSGVVLASVLWRAPNILSSVPTFDELAAALRANDIRLSLLNLALIAPLTLHLAARFPLRSPLAIPRIAAYYLLVVGITLATWALPIPLRQGALLLLLVTTYTGFGIAGVQLLRTIQIAQPTSPRAAQQARLMLLSLILGGAPLLLLPINQVFRLLIPYELVAGAQIMLPIGIAYTILRHDLFGVDAALRRALDYAIVSFGLLVVYFGLTALLTQISRDLGGTWGLAATILSVIASAAAFTPLRRMAQRLVDQVFYPERLRFGQAISAARMRLAQVVQREAVIALFEEEIPRQLGAGWAQIVLRPSFDQPAAAAQPGVWSTLLTVGGQPIGSYWLGPRGSGLGYAADEQEQLQSLTQQAALALAYAETFDTLEQLNAELEERVTIRTEHVLAQQRELAALEERQRLARELHDSVKQMLFSIGIGLRAARGRVRSDPEAAIGLLQQHEQTAIQAQEELGDLLVQLRTPATGPADLVVLLAQHAAWLTQRHGMNIALQLPPALVLAEPLPRELTQIAREALHNVLRHSGVAEAQLTLSVERGQLTLAISDRGCGFSRAAPHLSHGLRSMYERVALLGGTLQIQAAPGEGTSIWVQIPLGE